MNEDKANIGQIINSVVKKGEQVDFDMNVNKEEKTLYIRMKEGKLVVNVYKIFYGSIFD
ncbi:MAG: hypothetical protein ACFFD2_12865 [Promethearchaeota archaeon]